MSATFEKRLEVYADIILRVGLNLERGQRLLITEPYELQGVARSAERLVEAIRSRTDGPVEIIWGDADRLRKFALHKDWAGLSRLVADNAVKMDQYASRGDALLFLHGIHPDLMRDIPAQSLAELRRIGWEYFGPVAQHLVGGATNWTVAPAPSLDWADLVFPDLPAAQRLPALWETIFAACRVDEAAPLAAWETHLRTLEKERMVLNNRKLTGLRYRGNGTDLTVTLAPEHVWCTAQLLTKWGRPFVANLPTEEVFTTPRQFSATGVVKVGRPISYSGTTISGIDLEFQSGRAVKARAEAGETLLHELLATDEGAARLGEVALVPDKTVLARAGRYFHHPLLDENASNHIGLGNAYSFCLRPSSVEKPNQSLIHVDLSLDADVELLELEPS